MSKPAVTFRKKIAAQPSYVLYTGARPATWAVLVDGVERGAIVGRVHQYSRDRRFVLSIDGAVVQAFGFSRLRDARKAAQAYFSDGSAS